MPSFHTNALGRLRFKCDGTRAETRIRLSAKRTSVFNFDVLLTVHLSIILVINQLHVHKVVL